MRAAGDGPDGARLRALVVILWRAGLRIGEALDLAAAIRACQSRDHLDLSTGHRQRRDHRHRPLPPGALDLRNRGAVRRSVTRLAGSAEPSSRSCGPSSLEGGPPPCLPRFAGLGRNAWDTRRIARAGLPRVPADRRCRDTSWPRCQVLRGSCAASRGAGASLRDGSSTTIRAWKAMRWR